MASVFSHPAVVLGLGPLFVPARSPKKVLCLGALCSVLPDVDAIGFWLGIPYGAPLGHRGLTHSIAFAAAVAAAITFAESWRQPSGRGRRALFLFLFLCGVSHGLLDAMTDGGLGVAFFAPLDDTRYFLPWRPIRVSPIGVRGFVGPWGLAVLESEILWIWLPSLAVGMVATLVQRKRGEAGRITDRGK